MHLSRFADEQLTQLLKKCTYLDPRYDALEEDVNVVTEALIVESVAAGKQAP